MRDLNLRPRHYQWRALTSWANRPHSSWWSVVDVSPLHPIWWRHRDSNPGPPACKAGALANWANPPREKREEILKKHLHELMSPSRNWSLEHIRPSRCVVPGRLELPTSTLSVWRSNQLSYRTELEESTEAILSDFPFSYSWIQSQCSTRRKTNQGSFSSLDITVKL